MCPTYRAHMVSGAMKPALLRLTAGVRRADGRVRRWVQRFLNAFLFLLAGGAAVGIVIGIVIGIIMFVFDGPGSPNTVEDRSAVVRNVGLVLGGLFALWIAVWRSRVADRQAKATQRQADTEQQRLLDGRHQQGAAMLASELLPARLAGIYALQRLAEGHPDEYHIQIMRLLCAFVRHPTIDDLEESSAEEADRSPVRSSSHRLREDVQAAIEAISACHERHYVSASAAGFNLDLRGANLRSAELERLNSATGRLGNENRHSRISEKLRPRAWRLTTWPSGRDRGAFLLGADMTEALLDHARLDRISLTYARLDGAQLQGASLLEAELTEATLRGASLNSAWLQEAHLRGASLGGADLTSASLLDADLSGATFSPLVFDRAPAKGLTQEQLDEARADPDNPPRLDGVRDAATGEQLIWRGKPLEDSA